MILKGGFILLLCCTHFIDAQKSIDMDYYLSYLRKPNCYGKQGLRNCEKSCQNVPVICDDGECYCHQSVVDAISSSKPSVALIKQDVQLKMSSESGSRSDEHVSETMLIEEALRPALRHQIAHFCPDLEVARKCIRTCIKQGKPAFCGKDHVCYCGHKYGPNDSNKKHNALDVYKNFADMYAKYSLTPNDRYSKDVENDDNHKDEDNADNNKDEDNADNNKNEDNADNNKDEDNADNERDEDNDDNTGDEDTN